MKDGSSLVVTPSFIPNSATGRPNADLSSEGSEEVLEDSDDEPTMKKWISNLMRRRVISTTPRIWVHISHIC